MSLEQNAVQDFDALKKAVENEFRRLIAAIDGLFGINNGITPHVNNTKANVLGHLDAHVGNTPVATPGAAPDGVAPRALAPDDTKLSDVSGDSTDAANAAISAAKNEANNSQPATGAASTGE